MNSAELARLVGERLSGLDAEVNARLGIELVDIVAGEARCRLEVRSDMINSQRFCHGGLVFAVADAAVAYASCSTNRVGVTLSANVIFARPAQLGDVLVAHAKVRTDGRRVASCAVDVTNQHGQLVATLQTTSFRFEEAVVGLPAG